MQITSTFLGDIISADEDVEADLDWEDYNKPLEDLQIHDNPFKLTRRSKQSCSLAKFLQIYGHQIFKTKPKKEPGKYIIK